MSRSTGPRRVTDTRPSCPSHGTLTTRAGSLQPKAVSLPRCLHFAKQPPRPQEAGPTSSPPGGQGPANWDAVGGPRARAQATRRVPRACLLEPVPRARRSKDTRAAEHGPGGEPDGREGTGFVGPRPPAQTSEPRVPAQRQGPASPPESRTQARPARHRPPASACCCPPRPSSPRTNRGPRGSARTSRAAARTTRRPGSPAPSAAACT